MRKKLTFKLVKSTMTLSPLRASGFVIFRRLQGQIEYLLLRASDFNRHWSPPKGNVDRGETDMETAIRETREETGYTSQDLKIFEDAQKELNYIARNKSKIVIFWLAELLNKSKEVKLCREHSEFKWLPIQDACNIAEYPEMQSTLKYFDKYISENLL